MSTEPAGRLASEPVHPTRALRFLVLAAALVIPLRIIGHGHLPNDDARRHAAKVLSGKPWDEILVMRADMTAVDSNPGWHALLEGVHRLTGADAFALVWFSVIFLFVLFSAAGILGRRRPEAWLAALLVLAVLDFPALTRLLQGRPLVWSSTVVVAICLLWPRLDGERVDRRSLALAVALFALATWVHASWYLLAFPVAGCLLAGRWRPGRRLALCLLAGVITGALLSGKPIAFLQQTLRHGYLALGHSEPAATLAVEFLPFAGAPLMVLATAGLLLWRTARGSTRPPLSTDPAFAMAVLGWILGFVAIRFWSDWGIPALLVWIAAELEEVLEQAGSSARLRLRAAATVSLIAVLAITSDGGRWSRNDRKYVPLLTPDARASLPDEGGILYSFDMRLFFETFFAYPRAPWRYMVGFEPGLMPPEDLHVYRQGMKSLTADVVAPWVRRMRPEDRLMVSGTTAPPVPELAWHHVGGGFWSGRVR